MLNSMTGYGQAEGQVEGITFTVEIKTVNNRYLKTVIKLPEPIAFLEEDIEALLRRRLSRGTVNYVLRLRSAPPATLFDINEEALQKIVEKLSGALGGVKVGLTLDAAGLLGLPGILVAPSPDEQVSARLREAVLRASGEAIERARESRRVEGAALGRDLEKHCGAMKQFLDKIRRHSAVVLREYQERLKKRADELLAQVELKLDEATLAREVAVFAERSDISEEVARLEHHLEQFVEACGRGAEAGDDTAKAADNQTGRRLDFITQEMLREANTIASKASNSQIAEWVIEIKCCIDRLKEQVQNVE